MSNVSFHPKHFWPAHTPQVMLRKHDLADAFRLSPVASALSVRCDR